MIRSFRGFLRYSQRDRRDVFAETAKRLDTLPQHVEKDFWVCFVLDLLFGELPDGHPGLFFKGGTSLAKAFGVIDRLSEDIDLVVDRHDLGFTGDRDPFTAPGISKKRRGALLGQLQECCGAFMSGDLRTAMAERTANVGPNCTVSPDPTDASGQTLLIAYATLYPETYTAYVTPSVKIEGGARSATEPPVTRRVSAFIAAELDDASLGTDEITVISAERTYWEKLLILHGLCCGFRDEQRLPADKDRISRHYYDAAMLIDSEIGISAVARTDLLDSVRNHNLVAFRQAWKRFEEAVPGSISLVPPGELSTVVERDYRAMESMIFGHPPGFAWIVDQLRAVEARVNQA